VTDTKHYTFRVSWSGEDDEYVATVVEFPSLSWLDADQGKALRGLVGLVDEVVADMEAAGEPVPEPIADRRYSGKFNIRVPESLHRELTLAAAEEGVSLNRLVSDRLAHR
jgi:predicted RNase H-like HicB family nuclease